MPIPRYNLLASHRDHLAEVIKISETAISLIFISGERRPSKKTAMAMYERFGIPFEVSFYGTPYQIRKAYHEAAMDQAAQRMG